jgi:hypothetical protein
MKNNIKLTIDNEQSSDNYKPLFKLAQKIVSIVKKIFSGLKFKKSDQF